MLESVKRLLSEYNINLCNALPLSSCRIHRAYLLEKNGIKPDCGGTVFMLAVPYLAKTDIIPNISAYAVPENYHKFMEELFDDVLPRLRNEFPGNTFAGFTDHSPIDERDAAAAAGIGVIGKNGLLITEPYSSYIFLGEIITDAHTECAPSEIKFCEGCGKCTLSCPYGISGNCLSAVTQKKGELTEEEKAVILKYGSAWGCDICQEVCPHTQRAIKAGSIYTKIPYFTRSLTPRLTYKIVSSMSDDDFARRAYSWRGRETILRNLSLFEDKKQ
jgi:epoxyqueuosine reductase QueG